MDPCAPHTVKSVPPVASPASKAGAYIGLILHTQPDHVTVVSSRGSAWRALSTFGRLNDMLDCLLLLSFKHVGHASSRLYDVRDEALAG